MAGELKLNILSGFNDKGVREAMGGLKGLSNGFKDLTKQLLGGYVGWQGLQKGISFIRESVDASRDLQRNLAGLKTIFGEATAEMTLFAESGVKMGMSTAEAAKASTFIGSVMKQSGFAMSDNIVLTKELVSLGADLAATYGYDVQEALTGMTALFRGEYDPIEKFGVAIKQAQVNAEMATLGFNKLTGSEKLHAQQLVRMKLLFAATADAQGAFARQGDTLFVSQQKLASTWTNMQAKLGNSLIGPLTVLVQIMQDLTTTVGPAFENLFSAIGAYFVSAGGSALGFATQVADLIDQVANFVRSIKWVVDVIVWIFSHFGSAILSGLVAFKVLSGIYKGATAIMGAYTAVIEAQAAKAAILAAANSAVAASEVAVGEAAVASSTAMLATPWGAIAAGLALIGGSWVWFAGEVDKSVKKGDESARAYSDYIGQQLAPAFGTLSEQYMDSARSATVYTGTLAQQAAALSAARDETIAYAIGARVAANANRLASSASASTNPADEINKMISDFQKSIGAVHSMGSSLGRGARNAANALSNPFKDAVKKIQDEIGALHDSIMGAFDITSMGKSGSTISRNMSKLMTKMREFTALVRQLKEKGLNADLLQQIVKAGPVAGLDAARALAGNAGLMGQANASYAEFGSLATQVATDTIQAKYQNQYNITVSGGVGSGATIGKAVVTAIQAYERQSGNTWRA